MRKYIHSIDGSNLMTKDLQGFFIQKTNINASEMSNQKDNGALYRAAVVHFFAKI